MFVLIEADAVREGCGQVDSLRVSLSGDVVVLDCGRTYFIVDQRLDRIHSMARSLAASGNSVMCISRFHPDLVGQKYPSTGTESIWLSERPGARSVPPSQLSRLSQAVGAFVRQNQGGVVLLDGIEYLSLFNDFQRLQMFIEQMNDIVMESRAVLLVAVDPRLFDPRSLARLQRFAEILS